MNSALSDGKQNVIKLSECSLRLQQRLSNDGKAEVENEVSAVRHQYDQLTTVVNSRRSELEKLCDSWLQYEQSISTLYQWLDQVEAELKLGLKPNMDGAESKIQLERFKVSLIFKV